MVTSFHQESVFHHKATSDLGFVTPKNFQIHKDIVDTRFGPAMIANRSSDTTVTQSSEPKIHKNSQESVRSKYDKTNLSLAAQRNSNKR